MRTQPVTDRAGGGARPLAVRGHGSGGALRRDGVSPHRRAPVSAYLRPAGLLLVPTAGRPMSDVTTDVLGLPEWQVLEFVRRQRWFGAKTLEATGAHMIDHAVLRAEPRLLDALVEIRY